MFTEKSFTDTLDDILLKICETLQITETQYTLAEDRYHAAGKWLSQEDSFLAPYNPTIYSQGSLRIGTTVKPLTFQEFDVDLVCELNINYDSYNPLDVLNAVESRLRQNKIYEPMVEKKNRCVRLNYANEFHMDILPACPNGLDNNGNLKVPDRKAEAWKDSNPKGYANWFDTRAKYFREYAAKIAANVEPLPDLEPLERKPPLKGAVQLIKRYRDISFTGNDNSAPISIVLTTLAGMHYQGHFSVNESIQYILEGIINSIPNNERLIVLNPTNSAEDLSERWDKDTIAYIQFVKWINEFNNMWVKLNNTFGLENITAILRQMFGETVTNTALKAHTDHVEKARKQHLLGVTANTGILSSISAKESIPVKRNTFYGS
jgi:hypothetical protein